MGSDVSNCKHCHEQIEPYGDGTHHRHVTGDQARKNTCARNPYGQFHAEPAGLTLASLQVNKTALHWNGPTATLVQRYVDEGYQ